MLAERDPAILEALLVHKSLTSGELARLLNASQQGLRRCIRHRLIPAGLVVRLQRHPTEEVAYALGTAGFSYVAEQRNITLNKLPYPKKVLQNRTQFWWHDAAVNAVTITFRLACARAESPLHLERVVPEHELVPGAPTHGPRHRRYVLAEQFKDIDGKRQVHCPDSLFLVRPRTEQQPLVALFLELDRATESMTRITQKYAGAWHFWRQKRFRSSFGAAAMRMLFVLDQVRRPTRMSSMQQALLRFVADRGELGDQFARMFRFAHLEAVTENRLLSERVWYTVTNESRLLFQPITVVAESAA
jgi:hypothetical protein